MSVINTMLKDLERRGGNDAAAEDVLRGLSSATNVEYSKLSATNNYLVSGLSVLTVALMLVILYLVSPYQLTLASKQQQLAAVPEPVIETRAEKPLAATTVTADENEAALATIKPAAAEPVAEIVPLQEKTEVQPAVVADIKPKPVKPVETVAESTPAPPRQAFTSEVTTEVTGVEMIEEGVAEEEQVISKVQREPSSQEKSQQAYLEALSLYNRGRVQAARSSLKDALAHDAYNLDARKLLASIYLRENRPGIALAIIDKGIDNHADNQELLRLYLQAHVQLENYAQAIEIMEQRLRLSTPEDIAYLAGLYQKNNGHLSAVRLYSQALQLKPARSVWWMGQGISFEALSQQQEALKSYQQSIVSGQLSSQLAGYVKQRINAIEQQDKAAS